MFSKRYQDRRPIPARRCHNMKQPAIILTLRSLAFLPPRCSPRSTNILTFGVAATSSLLLRRRYPVGKIREISKSPVATTTGLKTGIPG